MSASLAVHKALGRIPPAAYYYASFGVISLLALLQTRALTHLLSPEAFGQLQLFLPVLAWCVTVGGLGLPTFVVRFYSRDGMRVFHESLLVALASTLLLAAVAVLAALRGSILGAAIHPSTTLTFVLAVGALQLFAVTKAMLRVRELHVAYNSVVVGERVLGVLGAVAAVAAFAHAPVEAYLLGGAVGTLGALVFVGWRGVAGLSWRLRVPGRDRFRQLLAYGLPVVGVMLVSDLFASASRYVIAASRGDHAAVARFVVGFSLTSMGFQALSEPLITYLHPRVFTAFEGQRRDVVERLVSKALLLYLLGGAGLAALLILLEDWLILLIAGPSYRLEPGVFPVLVAVSFSLGLYRFLATHYYLRRSTLELAGCYGLGLLASVGAALFLVRSHGLLGVASGLLLGAVLLCLFVWWRGRRVVKINVLSAWPLVGRGK